MWECNLAAVWGQMATGSHLQETFCVMGTPVVSKSCFIHTERGIGERWKDELEQSMIEAGCEEKRIAEMKGRYIS